MVAGIGIGIPMEGKPILCIIQGIMEGREAAGGSGKSVAKQHGKTFVITIKFSQITCNCLCWAKLGQRLPWRRVKEPLLGSQRMC